MAYTTGAFGALAAVTIISAFTAGAMLVVWLGERIDEKGIGNGISIILFAGIVARLPVTFGGVWQFFNLGLTSPSTSGQYLILAPLFIVLFLVVIWVIVFMNEAERRIPVLPDRMAIYGDLLPADNYVRILLYVRAVQSFGDGE